MAKRDSSRKPAFGERTDAPKAPQIMPLGATGLNHQWGQINDEPLLKLKGPRAMKEFREMYDNDAVVGGLVRLATEMISQTAWNIEAKGEDPATDQQAKMICETSLKDMDSTWQEFIDEVMSMAVFGNAPMEMWFKKRCGDSQLKEFRSTYNDGLYGLGNVQLRAQESLDAWNIADDGEILGLWNRPAPKYERRYLDMHRAILFRTNAVKNNPEGRSWLRPGWRSWFFVKRYQEMEGIGTERDVAGYPDLQMPLEYFLSSATADQQAMLALGKQMVERLRQDKLAGIVRPAEHGPDGNPTGHAFGLISGGSRNATVFDVIIKRYESRIGISLLGEFVLLGQNGVGSFALSSDKTHMFAIALGAVLNRIADVINRHLLPRLVRANGLPGACAPRLVFEDIESEDVGPFASAVGSLVGAGVLTPDNAVERYVRDYLNLPPEGEVSADQLADANGERQEEIDGADGRPVDEGDVKRALDNQVPVPEEKAAASMSPDDAAEMLNVSRNTIMRAIRSGKLPGARVGSSYRIMREDLMTHMRGIKKARRKR